MSELGPETAPKSSTTPEDRRQSGSTTQATPQLNEQRNTAWPQPEPEPVPSTSGICSKGKKLAHPRSRLFRRKRDNLEDSIITAFKFIKISGEWNEDDSSDDDYLDDMEREKKQNRDLELELEVGLDLELEQEKQQQEKQQQEQEQEQQQQQEQEQQQQQEQEQQQRTQKKKPNNFNYEDESAFLELALDPRNTYPQVYEEEDEPRPSTSFSSLQETVTSVNEPQPVREENIVEQDPFARAPAPVSPPPQRVRVSPLSRNVMSSMPFYNLRLPKETIRNLRESLGITIATILQEKAIPILLQEKDAFMHASSGSGKTVAFIIPVVHHVLCIKPQVCREDGVRILVIVPNKESAMKTFQIFNTVARFAPWVVVGQFGGGDHFRTERELTKRGVIILVTTPTRFLDHIRRTSNVFLKNLCCLVVDGLDEVLEQGDEKNLLDVITVVEKGVDYLHHPDYVNIIKKEHVEASRQTILISSSITQRVACFTGLYTTNPMMIDDKYNSPPRLISLPLPNPEAGILKLPPPLINQYYMIVPERMKLVALVGFVMWKFRVANERRILVFAGTQTMADYFCDLFLLAYGKTDPELDDENDKPFPALDVYKLNPFIQKKDKVNLLMTFSRSKCGILFCSDSAVMGIDLPRVDWVIHFHAPTCLASYMARIGLAHPGLQIGSSLSFLLPAEKGYIQELRDHDVPLSSIKLRQPFRHLWASYPSSCTIDDMIFEVQTNMEDIVHRSQGMRERACLAFASWCRLYSSYPENLKQIFRFESVHMDNYVHSFGLRGHSAFAINQARKLHSDSRRKHPRKRSAPAEAAGWPQESPAALPALPPPPSTEVQMPMQALAPTETPNGMEQNEPMCVQVEAVEDPCEKGHSESKKRKNEEMMVESDEEDGCQGKRSK